MSCNETPSDAIIRYAKEKYGNAFQEGYIDLADVFNFQWDKLYIFSPLAYPEDIMRAIGFKYDGEIVPDDIYMFLFVNDSAITKEYRNHDVRIGFSDDPETGVYEVDRNNSKYNQMHRQGQLLAL
jgi:hypothetical protein